MFASSSPTLRGVSSICRVSFTDGADVTHRVTASSMYEAVAPGLAELKKSGFAFTGVGPTTRLKIAVQPPATTHEISVSRFQAWLDTNGRTPREQAKKVTFQASTAACSGGGGTDPKCVFSADNAMRMRRQFCGFGGFLRPDKTGTADDLALNHRNLQEAAYYSRGPATQVDSKCK